jgi:hypothetical protein
MAAFITVRGAYGRTYRSGKAMKLDWNEGKDFRDVNTGRYVAAKDIAGLNVTVHGRYNNDRGICQLTSD